MNSDAFPYKSWHIFHRMIDFVLVRNDKQNRQPDDDKKKERLYIVPNDHLASAILFPSKLVVGNKKFDNIYVYI